MLGDIWCFEIDQGRLPKNGSGWGGDSNLNISYFAPSYYRVFANVSGEGRWGKEVVDYIYQVIGNNLNEANGNQTNGLVPAWSNSSGGPADGSGRWSRRCGDGRAAGLRRPASPRRTPPDWR